MRTQTMVQLTDRLVRLLDRRAASEGTSRSQVIREVVEAHLAHDEAQQRVARFHEAYERWPETDEELSTAAASARALVEEEPW
ncbi:MAG: ribbon-helix-helix protein, CopG family [Euzebyales bacterium]|nr:ribbon-helix-helix protein, CopG family [Euzebyales bacterium]